MVQIIFIMMEKIFHMHNFSAVFSFLFQRSSHILVGVVSFFYANLNSPVLIFQSVIFAFLRGIHSEIYQMVGPAKT